MALWKQLVLSALLLGGAFWLWQHADTARALIAPPKSDPPSAGKAAPAGVPVIVAPVAMARDDVVLEVVGTGRARHSVMLRSEASGKVTEIALAPNRRFSTGDVMLRLEDDRQRLALQLAETRLVEAERIRDRLERLEGAGTAATARLDTAVTEAEIARLEVVRARDALDDRVLRAPFDGVSGLSRIEPGAWVDSDVEIASYDDRSVLLVELDLPEAALNRIRPGMAVEARTAGFPGRLFAGSLSTIDSRLAADSRTARVQVEIPNAQDLLRPGGSFTVSLALPGPPHPAVPELAVQFARGGLHVWRVRDDVAEQVPVRLVRRRSGSALLDGPLAPGDRVVVEGTQRLRPGRAVTVTGVRSRPDP